MIYFSDSDCLFKLAACDLLNEAQAAISFTQSEVQVTNEPLLTLKRRQPFFEKQLSPAGYKRALAYVGGCSVIATLPDPTEELILENMLNLDGGEVDLICATKFVAQGVAFFLATGDKKWGRELSRQKAGSTIRDRLQSRCLHFEQIVLRIIETNSWPPIRDKIVPALGCDKGLADKIFIEGAATTKADAVARLKTSIARLHSETGTLFVP